VVGDDNATVNEKEKRVSMKMATVGSMAMKTVNETVNEKEKRVSMKMATVGMATVGSMAMKTVNEKAKKANKHEDNGKELEKRRKEESK
jgi:hypothetical protein